MKVFCLLSDPFVLVDLLHRDSLLGVDSEHLLDEVLGFSRNGRGRKVDRDINSHLEESDVVGSEGEASKEQSEQDDSGGPDVSHISVVGLLGLEDFRGTVFSGSNSSITLVGASSLAQSKVNDLDLSSDINHDVIEFDVSVSDSLGVDVGQSFQDLSENILSRRFRESSTLSGFHHGNKIHALDVFHEEVEVLLIFPGLESSSDSGVFDGFTDFDFSQDILAGGLIFLLGNSLESELSSRFISNKIDTAIASGSKILNDRERHNEYK